MKDNALYLEVDEDITSAIDKLKHASGASVQVVVPKRSTMLQSIINLKLLKKAADSGGKSIVLVTNDNIATELAARVGLAVAPSLGAKPVIAEVKVPEKTSAVDEIIEADDPEPPAPVEEPQPKPKSSKPLLRRMPVSDGPPPPPEPPATPAVTAGGLAAVGAEAGDAEAVTPPKPPKKNGPKVPNFHRLQRRVMWIAALVVLVGGYMLTMYLVTNAKVMLYATGTKVSIDTSFSVDPTLKSTDQAKSVLAGQTVSESKDLNGSFAPTGKQDVGTKAGGNITISNCLDTNPHLYVAGTRFQAPDGKIFRSTADATVPGGQGSFFGCTKPGTVTVAVTADQNGDSYNEAPATYTMPGLSSSQQTGQNAITCKGDQMSGGTSKTITIVSQSDVDTAKAALLAKDQDNAGRDLQSRVPSGYTPLTASQTTAVTTISPSPAVGSAGDTATLTLKVTYSVLSVKKSEYEDLLHAQEQKQVGSQNQIYDDGLGSAQVTATDKDATGRQAFHLTTEAYGGTKLDKVQLAGKLKGQRYGDAQNIASGLPGVTRADISIWPGWVGTMPRADKISITIHVAGNK